MDVVVLKEKDAASDKASEPSHDGGTDRYLLLWISGTDKNTLFPVMLEEW